MKLDAGISPFAVTVVLILFYPFDKPSAPLLHFDAFNTDKANERRQSCRIPLPGHRAIHSKQKVLIGFSC